MMRSDDVVMRTTIDIDAVVLAAARSKARLEGISMGRAVSDLALLGLHGGSMGLNHADEGGLYLIDGPDGHVVTDEMVAQALDDE